MMQTLQTIALLGATGKAGKFILNSLLEKGHQVKALVRNPDSFENHHPQLTVVPGDAADELTIDELVSGCQVVISAIGQRPGEPLIAALATANIIAAMEKHHIKKYIFLSGLNLDVPGDGKSPATEAKSAWMRQHFPDAVADKQQAYEVVAQTNLDWTMVRLSMLEQTAEKRGLKVSILDSPGETVSTADLADFVVGLINSDIYSRQAPFVAN